MSIADAQQTAESATLADIVDPSATGDAVRMPGRAPLSYDELRRATAEIAGGLAALGVAPGDRVAILSSARPEWVLADVGALRAGAVVVPIHDTNSPAECAFVLEHAGAKVVFAEDAEQTAKVALHRGVLTELEHVVAFDGDELTLDALRQLGADTGVPAVTRTADDPATIVYTSDGTAPPKGCMQTHANVRYVVERLALDAPTLLLDLPLAHTLARVTALATLATGGTLVFGSDEPPAATHVLTTPHRLEQLRRSALARGPLVRAALALCRGPLRRLAARIVLVRAPFGRRRPVILAGGGPLGAETRAFLAACGLTVREAYGVTETAAIAALGRPLPGTDVVIADDGEVLVRGPHVSAGYYRDPEPATLARRDGWLHTGDLGTFDADGCLRVIGRKQDLIITSSGRAISPEPLESALRATRWISQAVVVGEHRPYLVALVTLDPDEVPALAERVGVDAKLVARDVRTREVLWEDIQLANAGFARSEQIRRFAILTRDFSQADGELTPTLNVKRNVIHARYADAINRLYGQRGGP